MEPQLSKVAVQLLGERLVEQRSHLGESVDVELNQRRGRHHLPPDDDVFVSKPPTPSNDTATAFQVEAARVAYAGGPSGIAPSCWSIDSMSMTPQCSHTKPASSNRMMSIICTSMDLPDAGMPMNSPF